jgi:hypothetical protein
MQRVNMHRLSYTRTVSVLAALSFGQVNDAVADELVRYADPSKVDTYFLQHQIGANQGYYSLGLGYKFAIWEPSFSVGYTPAIKSGAQVVQGNFKSNWKVLQLEKPHLQLLVGASLLVNVSDKAFFQTPNKYPNKYYPPNAYFFAIQAAVRHHGFYIEASIIDYFLEVAARNENSVSYISDLLSVGVGYTQDVDFEWSDLGKPFKDLF